MQSQSADYLNALKKDVSLHATARLIAEWNYNRFAGPWNMPADYAFPKATIVNTGHVDEDTDEFPIESIVDANRPEHDGIVKARATSRTKWRTGGPQTVEGYVQSAYDDSNTGAGTRSYTVSSNSVYKYWTSPTASAITAPAPSYALDSGQLELTYSTNIWVNKIVATFEASVVVPKDVEISYKLAGSSDWTELPGVFQVDANGQIILYRQADDSFGAAEYFNNPFLIRGIRVNVPAISHSNAFLNVIEISARLESDLSDFIINYDVTNAISEHSMVTPLGICSSNEASIALSNVDGRFDNDRATLIGSGVTNIYYGIVDKNVRMRMDLGLDVNGTTEWVRQFTMWTDEWGSQNEEQTEVTLKDSSKYLQEVKPTNTLYQKITTAGIVWRMCDAVGFTSYQVDAEALADNHFIDYFWTDAEKTVWDHFKDVSQATQTAIFFDEFDVLQVLPRDAAYNVNKGVSWVFDSDKVAVGAPSRSASDYGKLADIIELTQTYDFEANKINVKYVPTTVSEMNKRIAVMENVWEPEDTVVLRSSRLLTTMLSTHQSFQITPADAKLWPYSGNVQIEGEFLHYTSKSYSYRLANGTWTSKYIWSEEQRLALDKLNPTLAYANYFNGYMFVGTDAQGRGIWGTAGNKTHAVDLSGWNYNRYRHGSGTVYFWNGGRIHNRDRGTMTLATNKSFGLMSWYTATLGTGNDAAPYWYGTRLKFPTSGYTYGAAGILIGAGGNDSGYYVEIVRTAGIAPAHRGTHHELNFYVKYSNGTVKRFGNNGGKGVPLGINPGTWYDLDVKFVLDPDGTRQFSIMVNGVTRMNVSVPLSQYTGEPMNGRHGLFVRGFTSAEFEYMYSSTWPENPAFDQEGWFDRIDGGYMSSQYDREWTYGWRILKKLRYRKAPVWVWSRYASRLMDEFGPVVHEVREYDVKFTKGPVIHSNLYISNDKQVVCPEYTATPHGASFVLANTARVNAVVHGTDNLTFGIDNPVEQKMLIYGRLINRGEVQTHTTRNEPGINRRGAVEVDIESDWIQTKTAAMEIGSWIAKHWSGGNDEIEIESMGNPLLQLGDVVAVDAPEKSMTFLANRYFVVGIAHSFDGGLTTRFTLRRNRPSKRG